MVDKALSAEEVYAIARPISNIVQLLHDRELATRFSEVDSKIKIALNKQAVSKDKKEAEKAKKAIDKIEKNKGNQLKRIEIYIEILKDNPKLNNILSKTDPTSLDVVLDDLQTKVKKELIEEKRIESSMLNKNLDLDNKLKSKKTFNRVLLDILNYRINRSDASSVEKYAIKIGDIVTLGDNSKVEVNKNNKARINKQLRSTIIKDLNDYINDEGTLKTLPKEVVDDIKDRIKDNPISKFQIKTTEDEQKKLEKNIEDLNEKIESVERQEKKLEEVEETIKTVRQYEEAIDKYEEQLKELEDNINRQLMEDLASQSVSLTETPLSRINRSNQIIKQHYKLNKKKPNRAIRFGDIAKYSSINELMMGEDGRIDPLLLIIYTSSDNFGHWVALTIDKDRNRINYFNSYGSFIDEAIDNIPEEHKKESNQSFPHLLKLLSESKYEVHWNDKPLQSMINEEGKIINTCGRWVGLFMNKTPEVTIEEFGKNFMKFPELERDALIVELTNKYLEFYDKLPLSDKQPIIWL